MPLLLLFCKRSRSARLLGCNSSIQRLQQRLRESGYSHLSSLGSNAQGGAVEYGWVVLDPSLETADAWAREFGQAGTLYWRQGEPVRLRMLWPRPHDLPDGPFIDWA